MKIVIVVPNFIRIIKVVVVQNNFGNPCSNGSRRKLVDCTLEWYSPNAKIMGNVFITKTNVTLYTTIECLFFYCLLFTICILS